MAGQGVEKLRAQYRECYHLKAATRRAVGLCAKCGSPAFSGLTYCGPCTDNHNARRPLELKNAQSRRHARPKAASFFTAAVHLHGGPSVALRALSVCITTRTFSRTSRCEIRHAA